MKWTIPGTILTAERGEEKSTEQQIRSMFLAGGIVLSQVTGVTGLEPYLVQNWVKRGFLPPPQNKRYSLNQLCRIININMLKSALPLETICGLLTYINGSLSDESDDIIDDSALYFMFLKLASKARTLDEEEEWQEAIDEVLESYHEPYEGAKMRVEKVLKIMVTAWIASRFKVAAEKMAIELND